MGDLIRRQEAIDVANRLIGDTKVCKIGTKSFRDGIIDGYCRMRSELLDLPSAQLDLSEYSDKLWKRAYASGYARCKDDVIDLLEKWSDGYEYIETETESAIKELRDLQSEEPELL